MFTEPSLRERLEALADSRLADFSRKLMPGVTRPVLGVRVPQLRTLARELASRPDAGQWLSVDPARASFEEIVLAGLLVGRLKTDADTWFTRVADYVPLIDNWAACDVPCSSFTRIRRDAERGWAFLQPYLDSRQEYAQRFGIVMLLDHYVCDDWVDRVLERLSHVDPAGYYARMALGWALSVYFVKFPEHTLPYLERPGLDAESRRMALQKILESRRLAEAWRPLIVQLRQRKS